MECWSRFSGLPTRQCLGRPALTPVLNRPRCFSLAPSTLLSHYRRCTPASVNAHAVLLPCVGDVAQTAQREQSKKEASLYSKMFKKAAAPAARAATATTEGATGPEDTSNNAAGEAIAEVAPPEVAAA